MSTIDGPIYAGFEQVKVLRLRLEDLVRRHRGIIERLDMSAVAARWQDDLGELQTRVHEDSFKVLVLGQFNRGKSTFINALIGKQVLPSYATPTTAVINEVKYGDEPRIVLYPRAGAKRKRPPEPVEVPVDELEQHVVVDANDADKPNPYTRADVFWPLDLCRSGVELIDSPGLNEDRIREQMTLGYLSRADAVMMLLDATQPATASEREFFTDYVRPLGHEDVFWVFNRINLVDEDERDDVKAWARRVLEEFGDSAQRIFFVDAKGALKARVAGDDERLLRSNLPAVERSLERFLARQRGRNKVLIPARQLQRSVRDVGEAVADELDLLDRSVEDLREAYRRNKGPLDRLESRVHLLADNLDHRLDSLTRSVDIQAAEYLDRLGSRLEDLTFAVAVENSEALVNPVRLPSVARELNGDVVHGVGRAVQAELTRWASTHLMHFIDDEMQKIENDVRNDVRDFEQELHQVRLDLSLVAAHADSSDRQLPGAIPVASTARLGTTGVEFVGSTLLVGAVGGSVGFGGAAIVVSVLGVGSAVALPAMALVATLVALASAAGAGTRGQLAGLVKRRVASTLKEGWDAQARETHERIVAQTKEQLSQLKAQFRTDLTARVAIVQEQVDSAMQEMNHGQATVDARKHVLGGLARELEEVETELEDLIDQVISLDSAVAPEAAAD